jgi:FHA domain
LPDQRIPDTAADLKQRLEAERKQLPFMVFRDNEGTQRIITLDPSCDELTVGRADECDLCVGWDDEVSRLHTRLERSGGSWTVYDGGLSRNGTFLNGERVHGHRVLDDGDQLRVGTTEMCFRDTAPKRPPTVRARGELGDPGVSAAQRKVLLALCAPSRDHSPFAKPASNREIAAQLVLSVEAVKSHLRVLFAKFGLEELPPNEKRTRLVEHAFQRGLVRDSDFDDDPR